MQLLQSPILVFRIILIFPKFNSSCYFQVELLSSIVMTFACQYFDSLLSTRGLRSQFETKFHPDEMKLPFVTVLYVSLHHKKYLNWSNTCELNIQGSQTVVGLATSDSIVRTSIPNMQGHFIQFQSLVPSFNQLNPRDQSAFNGSLQSDSKEPTTDDKMVLARDLQALVKFKQEQIQELIDQKIISGPARKFNSQQN